MKGKIRQNTRKIVKWMTAPIRHKRLQIRLQKDAEKFAFSKETAQRQRGLILDVSQWKELSRRIHASKLQDEYAQHEVRMQNKLETRKRALDRLSSKKRPRFKK